jgi:DNA-binding PadR family transcriptional regulator
MEVLLGLLTVEPMSGYDLGQAIRDSIGHFWNESYGQIYPNLKKLQASGFVASKLEKQKGKPDRRIFSITQKGRERLQTWLAVEPQPEIPRNELLLKLFFGAQAGPETLIAYVEQMAKQQSAFLQQLKQAQKEIAKSQQYPDAPYWKIAARFGEFEMEAHIKWAQETSAELHKINAQRPSHGTHKEKTHAAK